MKRLIVIFFLVPVYVFSQQQPDASRIHQRLKKLGVLTSVLYMAAHPDDENTRVITYFANDRLATTAYLSLTRGDGGQNLIGSEIRDQLGVLRTQELLAARRIDGGQQFFTRANDFGFSKSPKETFKIWGEEEILSDVVTIIRQYQPDVIITRFPPDERAGHGHHTASAMLAEKGFEAAARADQYPDQARELGPWQVKRLYTNTGRWWNTSINENTPGVVTLPVGGYSPLLGMSYTEIAAISRSQHRSQGFGSAGTRGDQPEFLEYVRGQRAEKDLFEGINTTWTRLQGGERIQPLVDKAIASFRHEAPAESVPALLQIRQEMLKLSPSVWRDRKLDEVEQLVQDCLGLYVEATANTYQSAAGQSVRTTLELVNRSSTTVSIVRIVARGLGFDSTCSVPLKNNMLVNIKTTKTIKTREFSSPYWLSEPHGIGRFTVQDPRLIGQAENPPAISVSVLYNVGGQVITITRPLIYKWTDPSRGELSRPFQVVPPVVVTLSSSVLIFPDTTSRTVNVTLVATGNGAVQGGLRLEAPTGWKITPNSIPFKLTFRGEEQVVSFRVSPSSVEETQTLKAFAVVDKAGTFDRSMQTIQYDHIPTQTLLPRAEARLVRVALKKSGSVVGYIKGAGDDIPTALRVMGYDVLELKHEEITPDNLRRLDAVVLGIRAWNTQERIKFYMPILLQYVEQGGALITQYNTPGDVDASLLAPYPLTISRDRVTEEDAAVTILKPDHRVMQTPNKITQADFAGWVQERGLYFPNPWDQRYEAILSMNDTGESPAKNGSLLVAQYGSGYFVYTGLSFFRELPEGVPGAYRLFANLVSMGKRPAAPVARKGSKRKKQK
jgi:LmbE family N-acetylglucosaminyl deacetylase